ncbi:hypothetical protein [Spongiactinospora sp. TRM90649]|uniref:hypothetical protein n=1 Tax=Spongiactinospora sp. TRM90649 TaxID=3031114 RepID=UPI0023F6799D|nr:hypothetical protein [Spongiactinospora sp. TRM90649]MDF5754627.1 hypothetical protein [Spongiactinospora sp. TRM90649]
MSPTMKIKSRIRAVQGWIMVNFGRATGNQHLEAKGMAIRSENDPGQRAEKTGKMPRS